MAVTASVRKLGQTAHIVTSVGWMGAVTCFLALAVFGFVAERELEVRSAYVGMELICWAVIVPLSFLSPATGITQSLLTPWGLFRHHWVLAKLLVTLPCTAILLLHMLPTSQLAAAAMQGSLAGDAMHDLRVQLIADSVVAVAVLLFTTVLAVYKPGGATRGPLPLWVARLRAFSVIVALAFVAAHLLGGGMKGHGF